jgi:hypothetical protein
MGAWGVEPFENDGAGDFAAELGADHLESPDFLRESLEQLTAEDYLEVDAGQAIVACAAIIACMGGMDATGLPPRVRAWLDHHRGYDPGRLVPLALDALAQVTADAERSEIYDLWQETSDFAAWLATVQKIRLQLEALQRRG